MGARAHMSPRLLQILPADLEFGYIGRPERASPGEGYPAAHTVEQTRIIRTALDLERAGLGQPEEAAGRALGLHSVTVLLQAQLLRERSCRNAYEEDFRSPAAPRSPAPSSSRSASPSVALGFGEGRSLLLGKRNPSATPASRYSRPRSSPTTSTYGTRQSNKRDGDGGGAIYGCRSNPGNEPCIRANNLKGGRAFEFATRRQRGRADRDRQHRRRAVHDQRDRRRHRPERRPGRRQGRGRLRRRRRPRNKCAASRSATDSVAALPTPTATGPGRRP